MSLRPISLRGASVSLEPLSMTHLDQLVEAGFEPSIWRYMIGGGGSRSQLQTFIEEALELQRLGSALPFATIDNQTGKAVGSTRFGNIALEHKRLEIGWTWIGLPWQRTGINTEAKYLMMRYAFEELGCQRVEFKTNALNTRSRAAILRIGAKEEGVLRSHMINPDGTVRDTVYFSVIASEWPDVSKRLMDKMTRIHG